MRSKAIVVGGVLGAALVSGGWLMQAGSDARAPHPYQRARLFDQVMDLVGRNYVERLGEAELYGKATSGVLRELHDPHSAYLTTERLARLSESTTGRYQGIGVEVDVRDGWITVVAPLPGTPAELAGIQSGDRIVGIDGKVTQGWAPEEALRALRGSPGTTVNLTVERAGVRDPLPFSVARREIQFNPVQLATLLPGEVGYVRLVTFSRGAAAELRQSIDSLRRAGARSIVVDLRGNPGGLLEEGVAVSDLFLDQGLEIVEMRGRTREANQKLVDRAPQQFASLPVAVLIDSGSASAAEIVAGALQDHDRAVLVGRATYGKGSAQSVLPLTDGGAIKLTTALWYTPVGRSITRPQIVRADDAEEQRSSFVADTSGGRPTFRTRTGRTVYGGGGITPDVAIAADTLTDEERALESALGKRIPEFRQTLTAYARSLRTRHGVTSPDFSVTPAMIADFHAALQARGIVVDRAIFGAAAPHLAEAIAYEGARVLFGRRAEFRRRLTGDAELAAASRLLAGARSQDDVFRRARASTGAR